MLLNPIGFFPMILSVLGDLTITIACLQVKRDLASLVKFDLLSKVFMIYCLISFVWIIYDLLSRSFCLDHLWLAAMLAG